MSFCEAAFGGLSGLLRFEAKVLVAGFETLQGVEDERRFGRAARLVLLVFHFCDSKPISAMGLSPLRLSQNFLWAAPEIRLSAPTVAKWLANMQSLGFVHEISGRERHRLFVYEPYSTILNEGSEPLR